jgi:hypothetical protein
MLMQLGSRVISDNISVDCLYKWELRGVEMWVVSAAPRQPEEKRKYHDTIRDMIVAS